MKKNLIVAAALLVAVLPCFAEIRVKREGATEGNVTVNMAIYWNDKYGQPNFLSAKEYAKVVEPGFRAVGGNTTYTCHVYDDYDGAYEVHLMTGPSHPSFVSARHYYDGGYEETLYEKNDFYSFSAAKAKFDSLCQQCYNKIAK